MPDYLWAMAGRTLKCAAAASEPLLGQHSTSKPEVDPSVQLQTAQATVQAVCSCAPGWHGEDFSIEWPVALRRLLFDRIVTDC